MKYIFKELKRHLWRTILAISGYTIAVVFIILIIAVTRNNENDTVKILKGTGTHFIVYVPSGTPYNNVPFNSACCMDAQGCASATDVKGSGKDVKNGSLFSDGVYTKLLSRNFLRQIKQIEGVKDASPYLLYRKYEKQFKKDVLIGGIESIGPATQNNVCGSSDVIEGKFPATDTSEIVAEESFARSFNLHLNDTISYCDKKLRLVGIVNSGVRPGKADLYSTFNNLKFILKDQLNLNMSGFDLNVILVEVEDARIQSKVMETVKIQNQYATLSSYNCFKPAVNVISLLGKGSSVLYTIFFLFLTVFTAKTQTTALMERLREIGILKSMGWSNKKLSFQIIGGSVIQALTGTFTGSLLSLVILYLLNHSRTQLFGESVINIGGDQIFFVFAFSLTGALLASLFPVLKIFKFSAGDIMRSYL